MRGRHRAPRRVSTSAPSDGVSVPFAGTFSRLAGCAGLALRRLLAGGTAASGARLLQDGRVTGGGELAASVRGTLIGLKKGDKEGEGELGGGLVGLADVAIAGLTQIEFRWSVALHKLQ